MGADVCKLVHEALAESRTPGCAIAVSQRGETWSGGFGLANVATELPFTASTLLPIASMTKPYTATAAMALVQAGRLDLDDPVRRHLPEFRVRDEEASARMTVRDLLRHTAGFVGDRDDMDDPRAPAGEDALARAVGSMATLEQVTPVGEAWSYSNAGYMVLGRVIEALCGTTYEDAVERLVLAPLGLSSTTYFTERAVTGPLAVGHDAAEDGSFSVLGWPWACIRSVHPAGGLISNALDQLRWVRWWAGDAIACATDPLTPATRCAMVEERIPAGSMCDEMGIGWLVNIVNGTTVVHHAGSLWGAQSQSLFVPEAGLGLVILTNARGGVLLQQRVRDHVLEHWAGLRPPRRDPLEAGAQRIAPYLGRYRLPGATADAVIEVRPGDGGLTIGRRVEDDGELRDRVEARFFEPDRVVISEGPLQGLRAEFLRDAGGELSGLRFGARIALREREPELAVAP